MTRTKLTLIALLTPFGLYLHGLGIMGLLCLSVSLWFAAIHGPSNYRIARTFFFLPLGITRADVIDYIDYEHQEVPNDNHHTVRGHPSYDLIYKSSDETYVFTFNAQDHLIRKTMH